MANPGVPTSDLRELMQTLKECDGNKSEAARRLNMNRLTFTSRHRRAVAEGITGEVPAIPTADILPDDDIPIDDIVSLMSRRFEHRQANKQARRWRRFNVPTSGPYALMFFGDPHVDDDGCNWPLLRDHCELAASTPHLYAVSVGDQSNNWTGRLAKLYAEQETSASTARKLIRWLLVDSGVPWWLWIHGNHDAWASGIPIIEGMNCNQVVMEDWQAKCTLVSPSGHELRLWIAHNFPGHSQWNKLHGPQKAAQMSDWAHLYVGGHHHNWAIHQEEHDHRNFVYWLLRCRGYKHMDSYADHLGYGGQNYGSAIVVVVDPAADKLNAVTAFADPHEGVAFLKWKRRNV